MKDPFKYESLTTDGLEFIGETLAELGRLFAGPNGEQIQQLVVDAMSQGYPSRASGSDSSPHNPVDEYGQPVQASTATESAALEPDRHALSALQLAKDLTQLGSLAASVRPRLAACDPDRKVVCPNCKREIERGQARCGECHLSEDALPLCKNPNCGGEMKPGDRAGGRHKSTCYAYWKRYGRERPADLLGDAEKMLVERVDGVVHVGGVA